MSEFRPGRFEILPTVIKNLLIINVLIFLAQNTFSASFGSTINDMFALHYWRSDLFRPHQFVTHLFMHGSWSHLFLNMFTLWMFGSTLENIWGSKRFLIFYTICGIGAALCYMGVLTFENTRLLHDGNAFLNDPSIANFRALNDHFNLDDGGYQGTTMKNAFFHSPNDPTTIEYTKFFVRQYMSEYVNGFVVGASGAIYGVLFAFGFLFPNSLLYLYFLVPIKAKYVVGFMIAMELFLGIQNAPGDDTAHFAHLGGVLISFILLKIWNRNRGRNFY